MFQRGNLKVQGKIKFGCPFEFGLSMIIPLLKKFSDQHEGVFFQLEFGFASEMTNKLMNGELDFAFVDSVSSNKDIKVEYIYDEELSLCAHKNYLKRFGIIDNSLEYLKNLDYFRFSAGEPMLRMWFNHHFGEKDFSFKIKGELANVKGIEKFIIDEMGRGNCVKASNRTASR